MQKYYSILRLSKDDIIQAYEDLDELTPKIEKRVEELKPIQMKYLANKLGELYCEADYWTTLKDLFERMIKND